MSSLNPKLYRETPCEGCGELHPFEPAYSSHGDWCEESGGSREEVVIDYEAAAIANHDNDPSYAPPYWDDCTDDMKTWYRKHSRSIVLAALKSAGFTETFASGESSTE
jgi:hypothetical protein